VLEIPCDVLIAAALEQQITADNAERLDRQLVVEAVAHSSALRALYA